MNPYRHFAWGSAAGAILFWSASATLAANFKIERIEQNRGASITSSTFYEPVNVAQAPGDNNSIYIVERVQNVPTTTNPRLSGRIVQLDLATHAKTTVLDLGARSTAGTSTGTVNTDEGAYVMAFHPGFADPSSPGYQKFYLSSAERAPGTGNVPARNKVEEYTLTGTTATFSKLILQYDDNRYGTNSTSAWTSHTVDWIGFDPTATGPAKNYLYITTGDGGPQATDTTGTAPYTPYVNKAQDLNEVYGKVLRVDVSGASSTTPAADSAGRIRNFTTPGSNPLAGGGGLGEIWASGFRNPWRASFDRANGDLYIGDVGLNRYEEVDFLKAGNPVAGVVPDFGWPKREAIEQTRVSNADPTNTPTSGPQGNSFNPIFMLPHTTTPTDKAIIGGFIYRGPIAELYGKYIFGDQQSKHVYTLDFDFNFLHNTDPTTFDGTNGTLTDVTTAWNNLMTDPFNAGYNPANAGAVGPLFGFDEVVSFSEDNAGNLYILDLGTTGQYPAAGQGEIFRLVPVPEPSSIVLASLAALLMVPLRRRWNRRAAQV